MREDMTKVAQTWADETAEIARMDRESAAERCRRNTLAQRAKARRDRLASEGVGRNIRERAYTTTHGVVVVTYHDKDRTDVRLIPTEAPRA